MANLQANRTLSGSFAEVWVDGARIAELSELTLTVKVQREKVQFGMDVDSKITGYSGQGTMTLKQVYTRFFEVLEQAKQGIDLIRTDIAQTFESGYVGKVLNDYDNKLLLVTAINAYLKGLEGDVLDKTADNRCFVSLSGQRSYLESRGTDTSDMKDADILRANTGSQVFLEANLTFCDAMEDLSLVIAM